MKNKLMIGLLIVTQVGGIMATEILNLKVNKVPARSARSTAWYSNKPFFLNMTSVQKKQYIPLEATVELKENAFNNANKQAYQLKVLTARQAYQLELSTAWQAFKNANNPTWQSYQLNVSTAWQAYQLELSTALKAYQTAWKYSLNTTEGKEYTKAKQELYRFTNTIPNFMDKKTATPTTKHAQ